MHNKHADKIDLIIHKIFYIYIMLIIMQRAACATDLVVVLLRAWCDMAAGLVRFACAAQVHRNPHLASSETPPASQCAMMSAARRDVAAWQVSEVRCGDGCARWLRAQ